MNSEEKDRLIEELREREDRYRSITETSVDAILTADAGDAILTWNKGAELIFGHGVEITGSPITTIIPERYRRAHLNGLRRFLKTGERHIIDKTVELQAIRKNGTEFPVELSLSTWKSPSGVFFGAIIRDISERKHIEQVRENVERMMRHDLRSPLIGITGLAKSMQKAPKLTEKRRKAATLIQELGERTLRFIDRSRDLFQMEQGAYRLDPKQVNLLKLLDRIREELETLFTRKGIKFKVTFSGRLVERESEYIVLGEENLLEVMFSNLIKNAVESAPDGSSVVLSIGLEKRGRQDFHRIGIHNLGSIPKDVRDKFFAPYSTSGKKGGSGLGTHSALLVARTHHGDIHFTTSEKEGTHVTIFLPVKIVS